MNRLTNLFASALCVVAAALALTACGGGDAGAPPSNINQPTTAPPPDTTPPTVGIFNNLSTAPATGPVTFSFVFNEDVGNSFNIDAITVTGGSPGALTNVSVTQRTLVVTPTAGSTGTITVAVRVGSFSDLAGNINAVVPPAVEVPFNTGAKTQMALPVNFNSATVDYGLIGFGGAEDSTIAVDPTDAANNVAKVNRAAGAEAFAGTTITAAAGLGFSPKIPFNANDTRMSVRVWSPDANIPVRLKVEDHTDNTKSVETEATVTTAAGWQTLTFNFAPGSQVAGTAAINFANSYDKATIFFDFGRDKAAAVAKTYYFDDVTFVPGTGMPPPPSGDTVLADFDTVNPPFVGFEGAEGSSVGPAPSGGSGNAANLLRSGGKDFALGLVTLPNPLPLAANRKTISARVYSPTASIRMVLKLEQSGTGGAVNSGDIQANEIVAVGWQTLTWTVANLRTTYDTLVLLPNLGTVDAPPGKTYYYDDIKLLAATGGGGGGGGGALTFSSGFAAGALTVEGGQFGSFSGSNLDAFNCTGGPDWCGSFGDTTANLPAADTFFGHYYQTPSPASALYMGIFVLAPGFTGFVPGVDAPGIQINGQTSMKFRLNQNAEWFSSATKNVAVELVLGKFYPPNGNVCRIELRNILVPTAVTSTPYTVPLSSFAVVQDCGVPGLTTAIALATAPISQINFKGNGGTIRLTTPNGAESGANLTIPTAPPVVYPTVLVINGAITFE